LLLQLLARRCGMALMRGSLLLQPGGSAALTSARPAPHAPWRRFLARVPRAARPGRLDFGLFANHFCLPMPAPIARFADNDDQDD